jgi:hypothetical protein
MSDKPKSAWELALEKLQREDPAEIRKLTDEQKVAIAGIRRKYQARIAEAELASQDRLKSAVAAGRYDEMDRMHEELAAQKRRLNREMDEEIEKCRNA